MNAAGELEWLSVPPYFWVVLAITAAVWVLAYAVRGWLRSVRRIDEPIPYMLTDPIPYYCRVRGHSYRLDHSAWVCAQCGDRIPCGTRDAS
jgi:hypothetical protein